MNLIRFASLVPKRAAFVALSVLVCAPAVAAEIVGAGATFPAPLYAKWAEAYNKATGTRVNYQSVGSGAGIKQIQAKTVDFGASDMPLKPEDLAKDGLVQFPTVIGGRGARRERSRHQARRAQNDRPAARRHLPRQDQEVERPCHREPQSGPQVARPGHCNGQPGGWFRDHVHLHQLPLQGEPGVEGAGR